MTSDAATGSPRTRPSEELRATALQQFSAVGYAGTSLQQIADIAGYSKSSVLYHFASKEALLDAVLTPAIDELQRVMSIWLAAPANEQTRSAFVESFVDFLLHYRLEVHTFINQGAPLEDVPVIARANALIARLSDAVSAADSSIEAKLRFGIALGGAAFTLTAGLTYAGEPIRPDDGLRSALIRIVSELLSTVPPTR